MDAAPADPRDIEWEQPQPVYRVCFWTRLPGGPVGAGLRRGAWHSDEWRLTGANDVQEVLAWAVGPAGLGRRFELFVEASGTVGRGLVRLAGRDPTESAAMSPSP